jgi:Rrf2 family protein
MVRLSKKTEYALLAMQYIGGKPDDIVSAKEISEELNIPYDFLSKTLQVLLKYGLVISRQGKQGGYKLAKDVEEITVADIINAVEEKYAMSIVECFDGNGSVSCNRIKVCSIRDPLKKIQSRVEKVFSTTKLIELVDNYITTK